jgi:hypothetical protein
MAGEPEKKPKGFLRSAARHVPVAALSYGLGYGIARTALEVFLERPGVDATALRKYGPAVLGAAAVFAGNKADRALRERIAEDA